jgi:glycosyltransferase involved in cell wall biosynthesis
MMQKLDVVCPVFREEEMIELFHRKLTAELQPLEQRYRIRIIYVLDPSPDKTEPLLQAISARDPRVEVIVMSRRFGHQAALIAGIDCSRGDAVVMLDSDLQHPPELIAPMVEHWENGADIVQMVRQDGSETGTIKGLTSRWFYSLLQRVGGIDLPAGASDYRLLSQHVAEVVRAQITERNPFLRGLVSWVGFNIAHVPFVPGARSGGRSHYRTSTLINFALNGICSFSKFPLRFCVALGMIIAILSFLGGFLEIAFYMSGTIEVPGWASLIAALCFLSGVQLFFLGVIGEYIGLIFDEVKGRPRYIADHRYIRGRLARCEGAERTSVAPTVQDDAVIDQRAERL